MSRRYNPPDVSGMFTLKVDNISYRCTSGELRDLFEKYGDIGDIYIPRDNRTGDPRGFAFVRFMDKYDAEEAMKHMDRTDLDGRILRVQFAMQRRPDNPREYYMREYRERRYSNRSISPPRNYDRGYSHRSRSPIRRERYRSRSYSQDRNEIRGRSRSPGRR